MPKELEDQEIRIPIRPEVDNAQKVTSDLKGLSETLKGQEQQLNKLSKAAKLAQQSMKHFSDASNRLKRGNLSPEQLSKLQDFKKAADARQKIEKSSQAGNLVQTQSIQDAIKNMPGFQRPTAKDSSYKGLTDQLRAEETAAKEAAKEAERLAREQAKAEEQAAKEAERAAREAAKEEERIARDKAKELAALAKEQAKQERQAAKEAAQAVKEEARKKAEAEKQAAREAREAERESAKKADEHRKALQRLASAAASAGRSIKSKLSSKLQELGRKFTTPIRKASEFLAAIKRIALYRAIRTAMKEVTQGLSEGTRNLYDWSALGEGRFKAVMDSMASSFLYLKNSVGAAAAPLIGAFSRALDVIVDKAVNVINVLNQLFARLTGQNFWYKAKKAATEYAESANGAAKATRNQLMSFDELNNITTSDGGGSGSSEVGEDWFTVENLEEGSKRLVDRFNELIENFPAEELGQKLGEKINTGLSKVHEFLSEANWHELGSKIAGFVRSAIETTDFSMIGQVLADKMNVGIDTVSGFLDRMKQENENGETGWETTGRKLGEMITAWVKGVHWKDLGEAIHDLAVGIAELLSSAIKNIKWEDISQAVDDFFDGLGWEGMALMLSPLLIKVFEGAIVSALGSVGAAAAAGGVGTAAAGLGSVLAGLIGAAIVADLVIIADLVDIDEHGTIVVKTQEVVDEAGNVIVESEKKTLGQILLEGDAAANGWGDVTNKAKKKTEKDSKATIEAMEKVGAGSGKVLSDLKADARAWKKDSTTWVEESKNRNKRVSEDVSDLGAGFGLTLEQMKKDARDWATDIAKSASDTKKSMSDSTDSIKRSMNDAASTAAGTKTVIDDAFTHIGSSGFRMRDNISSATSKMNSDMSGTGERGKGLASTIAEAGKDAAAAFSDLRSSASDSHKEIRDAFGKTESKSGDLKNAIKDDTKDMKGSIDGLKSKVDELNKSDASIGIETPGLDSANSKLSSTYGYLDKIHKNSRITLSISAVNAGSAAGNAANGAIKALRDALNNVSFATGGFPQMGSIFLAGEQAGATELVGTINGRTGVASGQEITGIADAVYSTSESELEAMREQNSLLRALLGKDLVLAPSAALGRVNAQSAAMYARVTGA